MAVPMNQTDWLWRERQLHNWIRRGMHLDFWVTDRNEEPQKQVKQLLQMQQYMALLPPGSRCPCNRIVRWLHKSEEHWPCCGHYKRLAKTEQAWHPDDGNPWELPDSR